MLQKDFYPASPSIPSKPTDENHPVPELARELSEGLASTILLLAICDILPFLILTVILLIASPLLAPVGIIPMIVPIKRYFKKLKQLEKYSR